MTLGSVWAQVWRIVLVGVVLLTASVVAFLSGLGGRPTGWLWAWAASGAAAGVVAWLLWRHRVRTVAVLTVVVVALAVGVAIDRQSPAGPVMLGHALDEVELPEDAELVDQTRGGNMLCFDVCPTVHRTYLVPSESETDTLQRLRRAMRDAGYQLQDPVDAESFTTELESHRWYLRGRVEAGPSGRGVELSLDAVATG